MINTTHCPQVRPFHLSIIGFLWASCAIAGLSIGVFDVDVTPPIGSQMAYDPVINTWDMGLRARGIIIIGAGDPIVLCAIDWIGLGNDGYDAFREGLARGAQTHRDRVAVHALHQHDAPGCDFSAEAIASDYGVDPKRFHGDFAREVVGRLESAVKHSAESTQPLTHVGMGTGIVREVASNRRILGPDGKVRAMRFTTCTDPLLRDEPEGLIDPEVSVISLWSEERPVAVLSYYACHPQSYYRTGIPNPDFPGVARFFRQLAVPEALHIHFTGAGGNIGAGKYNDGNRKNRLLLAERLAEGMREAWDTTVKMPLEEQSVRWEVVPAALAPAPWLNRATLEAELRQAADPAAILGAATSLAWLNRCEAGHTIDISCLSLGNARIIHLPGELFVEYQIAAKRFRPDLFVAVAAYGDYGMGYIGTQEAYTQGGYETSEKASKVDPNSESVIMESIRKLLQAHE